MKEITTSTCYEDGILFDVIVSYVCRLGEVEIHSVKRVDNGLDITDSLQRDDFDMLELEIQKVEPPAPMFPFRFHPRDPQDD
jgi:hypothetical protein